MSNERSMMIAPSAKSTSSEPDSVIAAISTGQCTRYRAYASRPRKRSGLAESRRIGPPRESPWPDAMTAAVQMTGHSAK